MKFLSVAEVAKILGVSKPQVLKAVRGELGMRPLPALRIGRRVIIEESRLEEWVLEGLGEGEDVSSQAALPNR